jgi:SAM-dependent methyltransferase
MSDRYDFEYESFAEIYEVWTATAASTNPNLAFYIDTYLAAQGAIVELGVGDGRIAIEAARRGCSLAGVDLSPAMLARCRERAEQAGVAERLTLIEADFRHFDIPAPAALITLPYHSIGHLPSIEDKRKAVRHIFERLRPGGHFVFDDFLMTPQLMSHMRAVQLRAAYRGAAGKDCLLWVTSLIDEVKQTISVVTWEDILDAHGRMQERRYRRLSLSWLEPDQVRTLLTDAGFVIEACFGDFQRTPFDAGTASEHVWIARKPDECD